MVKMMNRQSIKSNLAEGESSLCVYFESCYSVVAIKGIFFIESSLEFVDELNSASSILHHC